MQGVSAPCQWFEGASANAESETYATTYVGLLTSLNGGWALSGVIIFYSVTTQEPQGLLYPAPRPLRRERSGKVTCSAWL